ncbi:dihydrofolate reductase [Poriferisphaera sp. WC338]|uniref:dihydrofolate reductase n=1 Tax=Poriferisphaera sp. WC338 TaxID=3425129 RepID=UPI003D81C17C
MKKLSLIAAMSENRVIGREGDLPWHLPDDMRWFVKQTKGHAVIMGRGNFESIGEKPLPGRRNIVISRNPDYEVAGVEVVATIEQAIELAREGDDEPFVIGGEAIYRLALPYATRMYLTLVHAEVEGDRLFPNFNPAAWEVAEKTEHVADEKHVYAMTFFTYDRVKEDV